MSRHTEETLGTGKRDLVDRFLSLSPIWRLAGAGALLVVAVLVAQDHVWPIAERWNVEADRISRSIERGRRLDASLDPRIERIAVALGPIEVPRSMAWIPRSMVVPAAGSRATVRSARSPGGASSVWSANWSSSPSLAP
jgi:hypothetical protein